MPICEPQRHVHEVLGSVRIFDENGEAHNHRFVGMTGEAILTDDGMSHFHRLITKTDFYEDHFHDIKVRFGRAIPVSNNRHVHFVYATTECSDGHKHEFIVATLIENPIGEDDSMISCR
ncbi:MAG: YmaF family protein [Clostridium sp.]|uniref:YmaF family protein n=1 Tax=Clostridium sp. TaxID=1506 RepID=UPI003F2E6F96